MQPDSGSQSMAETPAGMIRAYLDSNSGEASVPFHNLLTTWQVKEASEEDRARIDEELAEAGVEVVPSLGGLDPADEITLRIAPPPAKPASPPPWAMYE